MDGILLQFANLDRTTQWWLGIAIALTIFYAVMRPKRNRKDPLAPNGPRGSLASQRAVEQDMNNLLVELSNMSRQISAQLDTRAVKLELLIKEADERIATLNALSSTAPNFNENAHSFLAPPSAPGARSADREIDPRHGDIYELQDRHLTAQQIATKLNRHQGEIELILALRDRSTMRSLTHPAPAPTPIDPIEAPKPRRRKKSAVE